MVICSSRWKNSLKFKAGEFRLAVLPGRQGFRLLGWCEGVIELAIGLLRPFIGGPDAGGKKLMGRQRELIPLLRVPFTIGPSPVHFCAAAPGAGELPVDEGDAAAIGAEGDNSSAGIMVSTAAARKASSSCVSTSRVSGAAGADAFEAVVAASGVHAVSLRGSLRRRLRRARRHPRPSRIRGAEV